MQHDHLYFGDFRGTFQLKLVSLSAVHCLCTAKFFQGRPLCRQRLCSERAPPSMCTVQLLQLVLVERWNSIRRGSSWPADEPSSRRRAQPCLLVGVTNFMRHMDVT